VRSGGRALAPHLDRATQPRGRATVSIDDAGETPILREYRAIKAQRPFAISDRSREIQIIVTVALQHRVRAAKPAA